MKYIQNRESFKSGLIIKESSKVIEDLKINEAWTDKYDTLPSYKDSYGGRLLSFIFRKGVEKVNTGRVTKLLTDLENAINESIIEEVKKDEEVKKVLDETEKKSFISGIWEKLKKSKSKQDIDHVNDAIKSEAEVVPVEEIPMPIQVVVNYFDQRVVNVGNTEKSEESKSETTVSSKKEEPSKSEQTQEQPTSRSEESITHNFILDLLSSKNPYDMLKDKQIRKQFFVDLKTLINTKDYGQILVSYMDDKLKGDLNKLSIFAKSNVKDTTTEKDAKLANIEKLKQQRIQKQEELKNKPKSNKKEILKNIEKIESTTESLVYEAVDDILGDTLSLREDSIKKLVGSLNKFFGDKRIKKQTVIQKFFDKVNKLYQTFLGEGGETKKTEEPKVDKEVFNPEKEVTKEEVQNLLPVLYKKMDEEQKDESVKIINLLNKGVKEDGDKFTFNSSELDEEIKKSTNIGNTDVDPKLDSEVEKKTKDASIDPLEIVRVFNRANKIMVVNYMPSNRSEGKVSRRVANEYETLDGGAPSLDNNNGPYRSKKLWSVWNDGVLSLMKKYKEVLDSEKIIVYENGNKTVKKVNAPIVKFMSDMLNDSRATGGKESHQLEFLEKYFGLKSKDVDSYGRGGYGYNGIKGDIFDPSNKSKELQSSSNSTTGSFTDTKKDGGKVSKIVLSKMRDKTSGYAFSFQGIINGIKAYEGKLATMYCVGIKTFNKDHILFKMSVNNDWFVQAYNGKIKYTPEREEDRKKNIVYLMLCNYDAAIVPGGFLNFNAMPCVASDKIDETPISNIRVSKIQNLKILHGDDGLMMRMNSIDTKKKTIKDIFYNKPDTFTNIYNKMKNIEKSNPEEGEL